MGDPRLIGHYQFHVRVKKDPENPSSRMIRVPIGGILKDYYPVVIDEGLWQKVRDMRDANMKRPGQGGGNSFQFHNLFVHMIRCHECGGPLHMVFRRIRHPNSKYLECHNRRSYFTDENRKRICVNGRNFRYYDVEQIFFGGFKKIDLEALIPTKDELTMRMEALEGEIAVARRKQAETEENIENLTQSIKAVKNPKALGAFSRAA